MAGIRAYGRTVGTLPTGKRNLITDVAGVRVGHSTINRKATHTGVTVILPVEGKVYKHRPVAASYVLNGFGKTVGTVQLDELGCLETPIALTNTLCAGRVADALVTYTLEHNKSATSVNPVVGETNDGRINQIRTRAVTEDHVRAAMSAAGEDFAQGCVGAGTGTVCFGLKGGIGSASRVVELCGSSYTLGVLVQSNFGLMEDLLVCGEPVGTRIAAQLGAKGAADDDYGVIIAAAGKAAHLAGAMAANTILPVVGVPMKSSTLDGLDALLSTVQMPSGMPVATVAIDGATNAALLAAQILALSDPALAKRLSDYRAAQTAKVLEKDARISAEYSNL